MYEFLGVRESLEIENVIEGCIQLNLLKMFVRFRRKYRCLKFDL